MYRTIMSLLLIILASIVVIPCNAQEASKSKTDAAVKAPSIDELLLFFPTKYPKGNWNPQDLSFQDVSFTSKDGTKLHGWYCPAKNPRAVALLAHGNGGNITSRVAWLRYLQTRAKLSVFIFDYRGYGRSEGIPTVEGILQDATAARAELRELAEIKDKEMLLIGESLGGAVVVQLAARSSPRGLILQSTFSSLRDIADVHYPNLSWLVPKQKLNSVTQIADYHGPLLQSHGAADRTIPYSSGKKLFGAAHEPKKLLTIKKADHNNWLTREYLIELDQFIERISLDME